MTWQMTRAICQHPTPCNLETISSPDCHHLTTHHPPGQVDTISQPMTTIRHCNGSFSKAPLQQIAIVEAGKKMDNFLRNLHSDPVNSEGLILFELEMIRNYLQQLAERKILLLSCLQLLAYCCHALKTNCSV